MLPKGAYNPVETEKEILNFWLENKFYSPEYKSEKSDSTAFNFERETFSIILPPPNANGNLHLGHMSGYAYQDLMGRYNRMKGKKVLLLPGKDHAGIQTEVVFEKELESRGLKKNELGREKFYRKCYEFCMKNAKNARQQEINIGLSADFDRELFTLDPKVVNTVLETFTQMYEDGLIYRGKRLINWCVKDQSALADIDTEFKDSVTPFVYFKYGFTKPSEKALELKKKYEGQNIEWTFERNHTKDEKEQLPFAFGIDKDGTEIIGIGYDNQGSDNLVGRTIGIQMRLDQNYRIVVVNPEFDGNIEEEINKIFLFEIKYYAGAHIILFEENKSDNYYNDGFILGTVRPETKFGDTAIAVDPKDERYKEFVGNTYEVITLDGTAQINIIADYAVDMEFGTGAVKITPAHSLEDWEIASRHKEKCMPEKQVIGFDGKMNHLAGKYEGMWMKDARKAIIPDMKERGMLVYVDENYTNRIRICERCKRPIEPLVSHQWFVDTKPLKKKAKELVENGFTEIMPEGKKKTYLDWMNSPEDWCITRQLWWGYRIPVWYKGEKQEYIKETGEVKEKIAGKLMETKDDYKDLMKVKIGNPQYDKFDLVLIPGKHGYAKRSIYPEIKTIFPTGEILNIENQDDPSFVDYENEFIKCVFTENTTVVAHSLGSTAIIDYLLKTNKKIDHLILLAPSTKASSRYEAFKEKGFWKFESEYQKLEELVNKITIIHSNNDEHATSQDFNDLASIWSSAEIIEEKDKKHYAGPDYDISSYKLHDILKSSAQESLNIVDNEWNQDPDVLDTWFSSGQWPLATLMAKEGDVDQFYPTQVMETGWDIVLFWVTRMMLLNPYKAGKQISKEKITDNNIIPFQNVYLHGLVLDKNGVKMSKSKGNGIDPFEMMTKYGTDALRFSFVVGNSAGQNYRLYEEKIASYRNFCNKIWNASKFVLMNIEDPEKDLTKLNASSLELTADDKEMIEKLNKIIEDTNARMDKYYFGIAAQELYDSFWHEFADVYIEKIKTRLYTKDQEGNPVNTDIDSQNSRIAAQFVLYEALKTYLKLLHPFVPFITERIWKELPKPTDESETIMYSKWPESILF